MQTSLALAINVVVGQKVNARSAIVGNGTPRAIKVLQVFEGGFAGFNGECFENFAIVGDAIISTTTAANRQKIAAMRSAND